MGSARCSTILRRSLVELQQRVDLRAGVEAQPPRDHLLEAGRGLLLDHRSHLRGEAPARAQPSHSAASLKISVCAGTTRPEAQRRRGDSRGRGHALVDDADRPQRVDPCEEARDRALPAHPRAEARGDPLAQARHGHDRSHAARDSQDEAPQAQAQEAPAPGGPVQRDEHENKLLLQKMSRIITTHSEEFAPTTHKHGPSLNARARKWEALRVSKETRRSSRGSRSASRPSTRPSGRRSARRRSSGCGGSEVHYSPRRQPEGHRARRDRQAPPQRRDAEPNEKVREIIGWRPSTQARPSDYNAPPDLPAPAVTRRSPSVGYLHRCRRPRRPGRAREGASATPPPLRAPRSRRPRRRAPAVARAVVGQASATADAKADAGRRRELRRRLCGKGEGALTSVASSEEAAAPASGPPKVTEVVYAGGEGLHDRGEGPRGEAGDRHRRRRATTAAPC